MAESSVDVCDRGITATQEQSGAGVDMTTEDFRTHMVRLLSTVYGPYAFGICSLMIIWFSIVGPTLERQAIDFKKNEEAVRALEQVASSMEAISRSMERTATVLEGVVTKIGSK